MTVSMRVMSAGAGYAYLLSSVAAGDHARSMRTPLIDYYAEAGTPPGRWLGTALPSLAAGTITAGDTVTHEQLARLLGKAADPLTGQPLGRPYRATRPARARVTDADRAPRVPSRNPVAGFDFTFSAPKSISALWGVADAGLQQLIAAAHHEAINDCIALIERDIAATRAGTNGVRQLPVHGVIATVFDHYDSRSGDPQLHTHVVIANRVQADDRRWRTLDSRALHRATVAISEHYNALLADKITAIVGLQWGIRPRPRDRNPAWELTEVPDTLIEEFSQRSTDINTETARLIAEYVSTHGRAPSTQVIIRLRQQATLTTRPDKELRSLAALTADWRERARDHLGQDPAGWASTITAGRRPAALFRACDLDDELSAKIAAVVVEQVSAKRSIWRHWNLHAEASRQTMGFRFATAADRERIIATITARAATTSLQLTPPDLAHIPERLRNADGTSQLRPRWSTLYSSERILQAEDHLLGLLTTNDAPAIEPADDALVTSEGFRLDQDQRAVVTHIARSGRSLDVLVGPAGAGKTATLAALRTAWEAVQGSGSVIGLAPSAAASQVLADELDIPCDNTAKWLHEIKQGRWSFQAGQLVLLDEASLVGTLTLDTLARHAHRQGAKLVLIGDWAQLAAIDAGGAFGLLARSGTHVAELTDVRRFRNDWEKTASLRLRLGETSAVADYDAHGRLHAVTADTIHDTAYRAYLADTHAGRASILIAQSRSDVTALNRRARADRVASGHVTATGALLHDGSIAGTGDQVITRANDRRLIAGHTWVKNGDRWQVTAHHHDGSLTIQRVGQGSPASVTLPAAYVASDLELGYAITAHRAQGATIDTAHVIVPATGTTRETLYVAMTRGREANHAYIATDAEPDVRHLDDPDQPATPATVMHAILARPGADPSAHEAIATEHDTYTSIRQLVAEYETIAQTAARDRWTGIIDASPLTPEQADAILQSENIGALMAVLRRTETIGLPAANLLAGAITAAPLPTDTDPAALLTHRIEQALCRARRRGIRPPRTILGLVAKASRPETADIQRGLDEREHLIRQRAAAHLEQAAENREPWALALGTPPGDPATRQQWRTSALSAAAHHELITGSDAAGAAVNDESAERRMHLATAECQRLAQTAPTPDHHQARQGPARR